MPTTNSQKPKKLTHARRIAQAMDTAKELALPSRVDVCIVGGGASGLAAAIAAGRTCTSVLVLEADSECGRRILATGNGRCNFSNADLSPSFYNDPPFVAAVAGPTFEQDVRDFFEDLGLAWTSLEGRLYPRSLQASSVRSVLLGACKRGGVMLASGRECVEIAPDPEKSGCSDGYHRITYRELWSGGTKKSLRATSVIVATGGSGAPLSHSYHLESAPFSPIFCPIACVPQDGVDLRALDGRRAHVHARLFRGSRELAFEAGEVLFRTFGISGVFVFSFSRLALPGDVIELDLTESMSIQTLQTLIKSAGGPEGILDPLIAGAIGRSDDEVLSRMQHLRFIVEGLAQTESAHVHRGGLITAQFDPTTLEAYMCLGFFACGEALNVDGACGGYNLAWAWKSGYVAGRSAAAFTQTATAKA